MSRLIVINLGLPKTGTTTLGRALRRAGLHAADFRIRAGQTRHADLEGTYVGAALYEGFFHTGDPLARLDEFDGLAEISTLQDGLNCWPQTDWALLDAIRQRHPGVRFVASRRGARDLSMAMLRWSDLGSDRLPQQPIPGLPAGFGETTRERMQWIDGHYAHLRRLFAGDPAFLEYDLADPEAPNRIGAHIGRPLPWWGRANRSAHLDPISLETTP